MMNNFCSNSFPLTTRQNNSLKLIFQLTAGSVLQNRLKISSKSPLKHEKRHIIRKSHLYPPDFTGH